MKYVERTRQTAVDIEESASAPTRETSHGILRATRRNLSITQEVGYEPTKIFACPPFLDFTLTPFRYIPYDSPNRSTSNFTRNA